jgi:adenosyl cobinamide kinase/adenosyl cobinamide phosphate guanylyltransferase
MGKLAYAKALYGEDTQVCDLAAEEPELMFEARVVSNLQDGARSILKRGQRPVDFFAGNFSRLNGKILIGDEIGSGVVPVDPFERLWRDETGFLYQFLAAKADLVDRVWAGIPCRIKG